MSEAVGVIKEVKKVKEGTGQYGPWKCFHIRLEGFDNPISTFKEDQARLAHENIGSNAKLTYEENEKGPRLTEIAAPWNGQAAASNPAPWDEPAAKADIPSSDDRTERGIDAAVALKAASVAIQSMDASVTSANIHALADFHFEWLQSKRSGPPAGDESAEDIPF